MGLPVSFLQQRYDTYWDMKFGSSKMYLFRGQMNFLVILVVVLLMPMMLLQRGAMLALMAALGVSSWMLHGTACMLASMVSTSAISALQTGFRTPELLAIIACYYLNIGSTASPASIRVFFILMATLAVSGLVAWTMLVLSPKIQALLADKDRCVDELDSGVRATISGGARVPLPPALDGSARPQMETRRFKRTFFALPGNRPEPKRRPELESVGDALKHSKGARTSVAKRLFGRSLARTKPVAPAGAGDLDALAGALVPAARRDDAPTFTPVEAF